MSPSIINQWGLFSVCAGVGSPVAVCLNGADQSHKHTHNCVLQLETFSPFQQFYPHLSVSIVATKNGREESLAVCYWNGSNRQREKTSPGAVFFAPVDWQHHFIINCASRWVREQENEKKRVLGVSVWLMPVFGLVHQLECDEHVLRRLRYWQQ